MAVIYRALLVVLLGGVTGPAIGGWFSDNEASAPVQVVEPFLEWRSGPGVGYPIIHTSEKGEWIQVLKRRAGWVQVQGGDDRRGWVSVEAIEKTVNAAGGPVTLRAPDFAGFRERQWETGLMMGEFENAFVVSGYGDYRLTRNLSVELIASQVLGNASEIRMVTAGLVHQAFPHWRVSPFFTLGAGHMFVDPKASLAEPEERDHSLASAGLGVKAYVTGRYFVRAEVRDHKIFTNRSSNEEATEWKLGLSVYF